MPINTARCPNCGARVNHILRMDASPNEDSERMVKCPRCKTEFSVALDAVSQRTKFDMEELRQFEKLMNNDDDGFDKAVADDGGDSVEEALQRADEVFEEAKMALDEITLDAAGKTIDADQLLEVYSVPDVKSFAMDKVNKAARKAQAKYNLSDNVVEGVNDIAEKAYDQASEKVASKRRVMKRRKEG